LQEYEHSLKEPAPALPRGCAPAEYDGYRDIEWRMLKALGHDARTLMRTIEETLQQKDYPAVLRDLRHMVRLDGGRSALARLADELSTDDRPSVSGKAEGKLTEEKATLNKILSDEAGRHVVEFLVDNLPLEERDWGARALLRRLIEDSPDLADRLYKRMVRAASTDTDELWSYATFLNRERGDKDGAEVYFKRAIDANPKNASALSDYGQFLVGLARLSEGEKALLSAFEHYHRSERTNLAEVCFSLWLVSRMQGNNAEDWERRYKFLLQKGFERWYRWSFDRMLEQAETILPKDEFEYAKALALAFLDESKVADLEQYGRWRILEPLDPRLSAVHGTN
jgi:hypothetical protein